MFSVPLCHSSGLREVERGVDRLKQFLVLPGCDHRQHRPATIGDCWTTGHARELAWFEPVREQVRYRKKGGRLPSSVCRNVAAKPLIGGLS